MYFGNKRLNSCARTLARIFEIGYLLLIIFLGVLLSVFPILSGQDFWKLAHELLPNVTFSSVSATVFLLVNFLLILVYLVFCMLLWSQIRKIFDVTSGTDPNSIGPTPFQPENVQCLKRAGIYAIVSQAINIFYGLLIASLSRDPMTFVDTIASPLNSLAFILFAFCLAQLFAYGAQLQQETDGLV